MNLAPILLFVFNRPYHTKLTINALKKNKLACRSNLIIYSDGYNDNFNKKLVEEVRSYIKTVKGFSSVTIKKRNKNWGLAKNIIDGVSNTLSVHENVIVLEDDIVTSPGFLSLMNKGLSFYKYDVKVWHLSGWSYPINFQFSNDIFFSKVMNCWGWATWADRWKYFKKTPDVIINEWSKKKKFDFDLENSGFFYSQITANAKNKLNTWAVFWYATIYDNQGLCMNPSKSYVLNIGNDGSGVNSGINNLGDVKENLLEKKTNIFFPKKVKENKEALDNIKNFLKNNKPHIILRLWNKLYSLIKQMLQIK